MESHCGDNPRIARSDLRGKDIVRSRLSRGSIVVQAMTDSAGLRFCLGQLFLQQPSQGLNILGFMGYIIIEIWGGMVRGTHPYPRHIRNTNINLRGGTHLLCRERKQREQSINGKFVAMVRSLRHILEHQRKV